MPLGDKYTNPDSPCKRRGWQSVGNAAVASQIATRVAMLKRDIDRAIKSDDDFAAGEAHMALLEAEHALRVERGEVPPSPAEKAAFYASWEWNTARMKAIKASGRVCACCGATSAPIHVDHIEPISRKWFRRLDPDNLQVLCEACNRGKGAWDSTDWRGK